jgi:hypothetical protein
MLLKRPIQHVFAQLSESLRQISTDEYKMPSRILSGATIGQHVRHIIELFLCMEKGYETGVVNYEKRQRDYRIETDKNFALDLMLDVFNNLDKPNKDFILEAEDYCDTAEIVSVPSNYYRELTYNLEHTIHHMALIRVGINEVSTVELPVEFGMAYSTIKYRQQCAR